MPSTDFAKSFAESNLPYSDFLDHLKSDSKEAEILLEGDEISRTAVKLIQSGASPSTLALRQNEFEITQYFVKENITRTCDFCKLEKKVIPCTNSFMCNDCLAEVFFEFIRENPCVITFMANVIHYYTADLFSTFEPFLMRDLAEPELAEVEGKFYTNYVISAFVDSSLTVFPVIKQNCRKKYNDHPLWFDYNTINQNNHGLNLISDPEIRQKLLIEVKKALEDMKTNVYGIIDPVPVFEEIDRFYSEKN
jgi:hypothetical protein